MNILKITNHIFFRIDLKKKKNTCTVIGHWRGGDQNEKKMIGFT